MKKLILIMLLVIVILCGCQKTEEKLECEEYDNQEKCLVFVHKDDCKYCEKDYYYVNQYCKSNPDIKIYSYKINSEERVFKDIEIEGVPTLVLIDEEGVSVVAKGYIKVRRYLNNLNQD